MTGPGPAPMVTLDEALAAFGRVGEPGEPLTATEVGEALGCSRRTAYDKLEALAERGDLHTKKTGARGRVWWRPAGAHPAPSSPASSLGRTAFESFVRAVVDYAIFTLDPDGCIVSWNEGARRIKGYEEDAILGEHVSVFYTDDDVEAGVPEENLAGAAEAGRIEDEGWRRRQDGTRFWANVVITAVHDDAGELLGFTKVTRDMTDRREREEALRRERDLLDEVLETSPVSIAVVDADGTLVRANTQAKATLGLAGEDLDGQVIETGDVFDEDGRPVPPDERPSGRALRTGEPVVDEHVQVERPDGERRWLSVNATPILDAGGGVERVVLAGEDVTRLKEQARRLERQRDELQAELNEVFDRVTDAFCALDDEWRFTYVNDRAEEIIQRTEEEVLGERLWDAFPAAADGPVWDALHEAMATMESVSFEQFYEPLSVWVEVTAYPSDTGLSVYFRDVTERKEQERELEAQRARYRRLVENAPVAIAIFDDEGRLRFVNDAGVELVGGDAADELLGTPAEAFVHPDDRDQARAGLERVIEGREATPATELRLVGLGDAADEVSHAVVNSVPVTYEGEPASQTVLADITAQKDRERQLARQREQLAALDQLNGVVQDITHAAIESSTRDEIEELVCERLAAADSYRLAWVGAIDREAGQVRRRTAAGPEAFLDDLPVGTEERLAARGPTPNAARTGEIHVVQHLGDRQADEPWQAHALEHGVRSMAAIPIEYEGAIYGVLTICSARPSAFDPDESDVVVQLGGVMGHAITAIERKRALVSEEVVELRFRVRNLLGDLDVPAPGEGRITFDRLVPAGGDTVLGYGTVSGDAVDTLRALVDRRPHYERLKLIDRNGDHLRFEVAMADPPAVATLAAYGGRIASAAIEGSDYSMVVHVPPGTDIRELVEAVRRAYPGAEVVAQRRRTRERRSPQRPDAVGHDRLTDRQRSVLEAAFYAGFFEWPRASNGEEVADSLGIAPSTFHQHVRSGERKLVRALFEAPESG